MGWRWKCLANFAHASVSLRWLESRSGTQYCGTNVTSYLWGTDISGTTEGAGGIGGLLFDLSFSPQGSFCQLPVYDGNGNVIAYVATTDGHVRAQYEYGPACETLKELDSITIPNPIRFSSKHIDAETGYIHFGRRYLEMVHG